MSRKAKGLLVTLFLGGSGLLAEAMAAPPVVQAAAGGVEGEHLFAARCRGCHGIEPAGEQDVLELDKRGAPVLSFAGTRFKAAWLTAWLMAPTRLRPAGYLPYRYVVPTAAGDRVDETRLPGHPALGAEEAKAVAAYLGSLQRDLNPYPMAPPNSSIRAQVHFSKLLPCGGCHQARPGEGGISGPELYSAAARLNPEWMSAYLSDPRYWQVGLMPRVDMRSSQLAAIVEYLTQAVPSAAAPPSGTGAAPVAIAEVHEPRTRVERLYRMLCSQCHGVLGNGKGINARYLFVAPRKHSSSEEMGALTRDGIVTAIRSGGGAVGKSALMPAWGALLAAADIEQLADYVMTLSRGNAASGGKDTP